MPTKSKGKVQDKAKGTKLEVVVAGTHGSFDEMLAELRTADVRTEVATSTNCNASSSNKSSISAPLFGTPAAAEEIIEDVLMEACVRGDISQLRRWAKPGVRVTSAESLCHAVWYGEYEVVQCLVEELGADVNQAGDLGFTLMCIAALSGNLKIVKCLAIGLRVDVKIRPCLLQLGWES
jgi:hypothetical protein